MSSIYINGMYCILFSIKSDLISHTKYCSDVI